MQSGFAGFRFPSGMIIVAVRWYLGSPYDVEELLNDLELLTPDLLRLRVCSACSTSRSGSRDMATLMTRSWHATEPLVT
ncbi:MAG: hypothetical protein QOJ06_1202 [Pseudonocardiales bacterium]|nr:hypothetical protein [Pseudonocardiales bacterium]